MLVPCAGGRDRTGMICSLLLFLTGAEPPRSQRTENADFVTRRRIAATGRCMTRPRAAGCTTSRSMSGERVNLTRRWSADSRSPAVDRLHEWRRVPLAAVVDKQRPYRLLPNRQPARRRWPSQVARPAPTPQARRPRVADQQGRPPAELLEEGEDVGASADVVVRAERGVTVRVTTQVHRRDPEPSIRQNAGVVAVAAT